MSQHIRESKIQEQYKKINLNVTLCLITEGKAHIGERLSSTKFSSARNSLAERNAILIFLFFPNHKIYIKGGCSWLSHASEVHKRTFPTSLSLWEDFIYLEGRLEGNICLLQGRLP
jgi:hypothetical protein